MTSTHQDPDHIWAVWQMWVFVLPLQPDWGTEVCCCWTLGTFLCPHATLNLALKCRVNQWSNEIENLPAFSDAQHIFCYRFQIMQTKQKKKKRAYLFSCRDLNEKIERLLLSCQLILSFSQRTQTANLVFSTSGWLQLPRCDFTHV